MKKNIVFIIGGFSLIVFLAGLSFLYFQNKTLVVYIDTNELYSKYQGKKDLENRFNTNNERKKAFLDSLTLELKGMENRFLSASPTEKKSLAAIYGPKKENYEKFKDEFEQVLTTERSKYMDQIWTQLNQYVKEFGEQNGHRVILGANGDGSLMYADKSINVTKEALEYVNKKYAGK